MSAIFYRTTLVKGRGGYKGCECQEARVLEAGYHTLIGKERNGEEGRSLTLLIV